MRLLVVDDDPDIGDSMAQALRMHFPKLHVQVARSGPEGIQEVEQQKPDLILTDFRMPGMTGIEMLQKLRDDGHDVQAMLFTAYREEQRAVDAAKRGLIRRFHHKPPDLDALVVSVTELLYPEQLAGRRDRHERKRLRPTRSARGWWSRRRTMH